MIDEKKLIDILSKNSIFEKITNAEGKNIFEIIDDMPKADWIPCEVELPKQEYATCWIAVEVDQNKPYYYCSAVWTSKDGFRTHDIEAQGKVVAWRKVQPYKKEGAE